jgi:hypothetical protein
MYCFVLADKECVAFFTFLLHLTNSVDPDPNPHGYALI